MAKKIKVDVDLCIGCGSCQDLAPDYFKLVDEKCKVIKAEVEEADIDVVQSAVDNCPVGTIELIDEE